METLASYLFRYDRKAYILESQREFLLKTIAEHEASFDPLHMRDFIDVYLAQMEEERRQEAGDKDRKDNNAPMYSKADLCMMLMDFFHAGTETSSTTLKWVLLYMTRHQDWQEKCR